MAQQRDEVGWQGAVCSQSGWRWRVASAALLFSMGVVATAGPLALAGGGVQPVVEPVVTPSPIVGSVAARAGTVADVLRVPTELSSVADLARDTGLLSRWENSDAVTVLAPTNQAFAALPAPLRQTTPAYRPLLAELLRNHILPGRVMLGDRAAQTLTSASGSKFRVQRADTGSLQIEGAAVLQANVEASNGLIHAIDAVLPPADSAAIAMAYRISTLDDVAIALTDRAQVPPLSVPSRAWGFARLNYDPRSRRVTISGFADGLSSPPRVVGLSALNVFHAPVGQAGAIVRPLALTAASRVGTSATFDTEFTLTPLEAKQFLRGEFYLNLHTEANPSGELRGQLRASPGKGELEDGAIEFGPG